MSWSPPVKPNKENRSDYLGTKKSATKMGNCVGAASPEERDARSRSSAIDRQLRQDQREYENTIKILLLGKPADSAILFLALF